MPRLESGTHRDCFDTMIPEATIASARGFSAVTMIFPTLTKTCIGETGVDRMAGKVKQSTAVVTDAKAQGGKNEQDSFKPLCADVHLFPPCRWTLKTRFRRRLDLDVGRLHQSEYRCTSDGVINANSMLLLWRVTMVTCHRWLSTAGELARTASAASCTSGFTR